MINRRLLRLKTLQVLYAYTKNTDKTIAAAENELKHSIEKTYQLYLTVFNLIRNFRVRAEMRCEHLQTLPILEKEAYDQLSFLANNPFLLALAESSALDSAIEATPLQWDENDSYTADLFKQFLQSEAFTQFETKDNTFNSGKKLVLNYLLKELFLSEDFHSKLEEENIYWNDDISFVATMIEKTMRKCKVTEEKPIVILPLYAQEEDESFVLKLLRKSIANFNTYDETIKAFAKGWEFDRIADMDLIILRMGLVEAIEFPSIPIKVSLNEYIDMAKFYASGKSANFVNGILDRIYKKYTEEDKIKKTGRGLMQ